MRKTVFICSALNNNELINKSIFASSEIEAEEIFIKEFNVKPQNILGPFYKKKVVKKVNTTSIKFSNKTRKALYNNYIVNAFLLDEPYKSAFLIFLKRQDNKQLPLPKNNTIVSINELIFLDGEK